MAPQVRAHGTPGERLLPLGPEPGVAPRTSALAPVAKCSRVRLFVRRCLKMRTTGSGPCDVQPSFKGWSSNWFNPLSYLTASFPCHTQLVYLPEKAGLGVSCFQDVDNLGLLGKCHTLIMLSTLVLLFMQTDLCGLNDVKYNFVGTFETLSEDVKTVTARFGHKNLSVFKFNVHPTNTDSKLQNLYTKVSHAVPAHWVHPSTVSPVVCHVQVQCTPDQYR